MVEEPGGCQHTLRNVVAPKLVGRGSRSAERPSRDHRCLQPFDEIEAEKRAEPSAERVPPNRGVAQPSSGVIGPSRSISPDMCVGVLILVAEPPVKHWLRVKRLAPVYSPLVALIPQPSLCPSQGSSSIRRKSIDLSGPSVLRAFA